MDFRLLAALLCALPLGCARNPTLAEVGRFVITQHQADVRSAVERTLNPSETRELGLFQLARSFALAEIYTLHVRPIAPAALEAEAARIDRDTTAPEVLAKVKAVYGSDREAYLTTYVLPVLVERELYYEYFLKSSEPHVQSLAQAQAILHESLAHSERSLRSWANPSVHYGRMRVSAAQGFVTDANPRPAARPAEQDLARQWIRDILEPLKPGTTSSRLVNAGEAWQIVRLIRRSPRTPHTYEVESLVIPKIRFDRWVTQEKSKIKTWVRSGYSLEVPK